MCRGARTQTAANVIDLDPANTTRSVPTSRVVRILEADPDLGVGIPRAQWELAAAASTAPGFEFERGPWRFEPPPEPGSFGALILEGMILIRIDAGTRS